MKIKKSFEEIYNNIKEEHSNEINIALKSAKKEKNISNMIIVIICIIVDIFIWNKMKCFTETFTLNDTLIHSNGIYMFFSIMPRIIPILSFDILIFCFVNLIFRKKQSEYNIKFKKLVIKELMSNFYDNLKYYLNLGIPEQIYEKGKYKEYYNRYYSDDYLEAKINNLYDISIAEVKTQKVEHHTDSDGHSHTTTYTIFHGLFAKIVLDKSIKSELRISQNRSGRESKKSKVEMDSRRV